MCHLCLRIQVHLFVRRRQALLGLLVLLKGLVIPWGPCLLSFLAVQAGRPVQVLQEVLGFRLVLGNLGNQVFLCLLADLECLDLEGRGLPSVRLLQGILVVPLGQGVQMGLVAQVIQWWGIQVGHDLQVYQVYRAHL